MKSVKLGIIWWTI